MYISSLYQSLPLLLISLPTVHNKMTGFRLTANAIMFQVQESLPTKVIRNLQKITVQNLLQKIILLSLPKK